MNGSAAALGLRHKIYDLREHRFAANTLGLHHNPARCVHRATRNFHTDDFLHRQRLAREHGFINGCAALHDFAVHGNFFARSHAQEVAGMHVIKRHILVARGRYAAGGLGRQTEQCLNRAAGALAGAEFEHLTEKHQHGDDGGGLEVNSWLASVAGGSGERLRPEHCHRAEGVSGADTQRDEREHIEAPIHKRTPSAHEEGPTRP